MAISHVCPGCGLDLARLRATPDPHYGLAVVVCPGCRHACVRRRHPLLERWRGFNRLCGSLSVLGFQFVALASLTAVGVAPVLMVAGALRQADLGWDAVPAILAGSPPPRAGLRADDVLGFRIMLPLWAAAALAAGTWLAASFPHWRPGALWGAWAGWLLAWASTDVILWPVMRCYAWIGSEAVGWSPPSPAEWAGRAGAIAAGVAIAAVMIPVRRRMAALEPRRARWVFARRRRKRRKWRHGR